MDQKRGWLQEICNYLLLLIKIVVEDGKYGGEEMKIRMKKRGYRKCYSNYPYLLVKNKVLSEPET